MSQPPVPMPIPLVPVVVSSLANVLPQSMQVTLSITTWSKKSIPKAVAIVPFNIKSLNTHRLRYSPKNALPHTLFMLPVL